MVGPVCYQELLLAGRRNRQYVFRWIYAGWLLVQLLWICFSLGMTRLLATITGAPAGEDPVVAVSRKFVEWFVVQQLILMALATPAFAAGAIADEKRRGTLQYLLTTDLSSWHIVLGKLLGRTAQVAVLFLTGLPLFCFLGAFAGVEPLTLAVAALYLVLPLFALGAATMLASVWFRQTRDAVLFLMAVGVAGFVCIVTFGGVFQFFNPLYVIEPAWGVADSLELRELGVRLFGATVAWGSVAVVSLALAVWRLRPAYIKQLEGEGKKKRERWWRVARPPVSDQPITWKERQVEGLAPIDSLRRVPRWLVLVSVFGLTTFACLFLLYSTMPAGTRLEELARLALRGNFDAILLKLGPADGGFFVLGLVVMLLASLVVGIRCSGAVTGERERQTWEALLLSPLSAKQLIRGKMWGIMGASYWYVLAYAVPALALSALGNTGVPLPLATIWTVLWLAVTLLAMFFVGSAGIWCSTRSGSSWRSLLGTFGVAYVGGALLFSCSIPFLMILYGILALVVWLFVDRLLGTSLSALMVGTTGPWAGFFLCCYIGLALMFWILSRVFLASAQKWVADRERTRHWHDEPVYRPRRRKVLQAIPVVQPVRREDAEPVTPRSDDPAT